MSERPKAMDETWLAMGVALMPDDETLVKFPYAAGFGQACERARLAACAPEALRMLEKREWQDWDENPASCVECSAERPWDFLSEEEQDERGMGHKQDCAWLALMVKAGLR